MEFRKLKFVSYVQFLLEKISSAKNVNKRQIFYKPLSFLNVVYFANYATFKLQAHVLQFNEFFSN